MAANYPVPPGARHYGHTSPSPQPATTYQQSFQPNHPPMTGPPPMQRTGPPVAGPPITNKPNMGVPTPPQPMASPVAPVNTVTSAPPQSIPTPDPVPGRPQRRQYHDIQKISGLGISSPGRSTSSPNPQMYVPAHQKPSESENVSSPAYSGYGNLSPKPDFQYNSELNAGKQFLRPTLNVIPRTKAMLDASHLPLAIHLRPLAAETEEEPPPLVNTQTSPIVRCKMCRMYMHPNVQFTSNGRNWKCDICGIENAVVAQYFSPLVDGKRTDAMSRPELRSGSVEYIATEDYMTRPPIPTIHCFVFETSKQSAQSGVLQASCNAVKEMLAQLDLTEPHFVCFIVAGSTLSFFDVSETLSKPNELVIPKIDEPFLPNPKGLYHSYGDVKDNVELLLDIIPRMYSRNQDPANALGTAIASAQSVLARNGGVINLFMCSMPNCGLGKLETVEQKSYYGTAEKKKSSFHLYIFPGPTFIDVATVNSLSRFTSGQLFFYPHFNPTIHTPQLTADILAVNAEIGKEGVLRVRVSKGLKVTVYHGSFFVRTSNLLGLPVIVPNQNFSIQIGYESESLQGSHAVVQAALLYTPANLERLICVHTTVLPIVETIGDVFKNSDEEALACLFADLAIDQASQEGLVVARKKTRSQLTNILAYYKRFFQSSTNHTQLLLPQTLEVLPLYTCGLLKSRLLCGNVVADHRSALFLSTKCMSVKDRLSLLYPRLFPVTELDNDQYLLESDGEILLPPALKSSRLSLSNFHVYLLDNSQELLLWIGRDVSQEWANDVFGKQSLGQLQSFNLSPLESPKTDAGIRLNNLVSALRLRRSRSLRLFVFQQCHPNEDNYFGQFLYDDEVQGNPSYQSFLNSLHVAIQESNRI